MANRLVCYSCRIPNEVPEVASRYDEAHVLFLTWEDDLLGVSYEVFSGKGIITTRKNGEFQAIDPTFLRSLRR